MDAGLEQERLQQEAELNQKADDEEVESLHPGPPNTHNRQRGMSCWIIRAIS